MSQQFQEGGIIVGADWGVAADDSHVMYFDHDGVLLADVVGSGVARQAAGTRSGNPLHDTHSGKFGGGGGDPKKKAPANVDPAAFARYRDAVREAARKFPGQLTAENIQSFIADRADDPSAVNIQQFAQLVQQQQLDDLVDALAPNHGGFQVTAPKGYVSKTLAGLSDDDVTEIVARLKARGVKDPHLKFGRSLPKDRHETVKAKSDAKDEAAKVTAFDFEPTDDAVIFLERPPEKDWAQMADAITASMAKIPAPVINIAPPEVRVEPAQITVEVAAQPLTSKSVERDENGLITRVTEEPIE